MKAIKKSLVRRTRSIAQVVARLTVASVVLLMLVLAYGAATPISRILVLNSDSSVAKYAEVEMAFKASIGGPTMNVDVSRVSEAQVRRTIASSNPEVVYCIGTSAYQMAAKATRTKPIIFSSAINWQRFPKRRRTHAIANELPAEMQLTLFRHFFPRTKRVGVIYDRNMNRQWFGEAQKAGKEVGIEVVGYSIRRASQVDDGFRKLASEVDAFWLIPDPVVLESQTSVQRYFDLAHAARKAVFTYSPAFTALNPALILAPDMPTIGRQAAGLAQDLDSAEDSYSPAGSEVILNLRRVQEYGLDFNRDSLDSVNQIIR